MMIRLLILVISFVCISRVYAQDTLRNHSADVSLVAYTYTSPGSWGYYLGHNSNYRQQFAEKYTIAGSARVLGVISHLTGVYANPGNKVSFNIFEVGTSRFPAGKLAAKEVAYRDLDLSGKAMATWFDSPVSVSDSFFVALDLFDYAHGGYDGDTIGLLCSPDGSRTSNAISDKGRNVLQFHSHSSVAWRDYATQNFTPAHMDMVHFALYPVVEFTGITGLDKATVSSGSLSLSAPYPNPASGYIVLPLYLRESAVVTVDITDVQGRPVGQISAGMRSAGNSELTIDLSAFARGAYVYIIRTDKGTVAGRFSAQ